MMLKQSTIFAIAILSIAFTNGADAQQVRGHHLRRMGIQTTVSCDQHGCSDRRTPTNGTMARAQVVADANGNDGVVGHRPTGCPHAFCGCEASRYVFGEIRPELNLASNWIKKFPRTAPASGMAAARNHHVMVLINHVGGNDWLVHDGNSGGGLTREHVVSISGYTIIDPHGARTAAASSIVR